MADAPLSREMCEFILDFYAVDTDARKYLVSEAALVLPKGSWKSGVAAIIAVAEVLCPVVRPAGRAVEETTVKFGSWSHTFAAGDAIGADSLWGGVVILANSKDQAKATAYSEAWVALGGADSGGSERLITDYGIRTRDHVGRLSFTSPRGDSVAVVPAENPRSLDGLKPTLSVVDEGHLITGTANESVMMLSNNIAKKSGRLLHVSTAYGIGEDSALEQFFAQADEVKAGRTPNQNLLVHHAKPPRDADLQSQDGLRAALQDVYSAAPWVDVEPILAKFYDTRFATDTGKLKRLFLGLPSTPDVRFVSAEQVSAATLSYDFAPPPGSTITLGLDASRGVSAESKYPADATALVGCWIPSPTDGPDAKPVIFPIRIWQPRTNDWALDYDELDRVVREQFAKYRVVGFFADPPLIESCVAAWSRDFGNQLVAKADTTARPVAWWTNRGRQMHAALERYYAALSNLDINLAPDSTLAQHHVNAHRTPTRSGYYIRKDRQHSPRKMDAVMASVLAFAAAAEAIGLGASLGGDSTKKPRKKTVAMRARIR